VSRLSVGICGSVSKSSSVSIGDEINRVIGGEIANAGFETSDADLADDANDIDDEKEDEFENEEGSREPVGAVLGPAPKIDSAEVNAILDDDSCFN
jgi:hypothetical protein